MASCVLFINSRGEVLIYRSYKGDVARADIMPFCTKVVATKEAKETPVINLGGVHFLHTTHNDITLVAACKSNCNAALVLSFLYQLVNLCKAYFGGEFDENQVRKNFVLIYELLDEIMDFGLPQILEHHLLKQFITQGGKGEISAEQIRKTLGQVTGAVTWRADGIKYKKNEVYIDVIENVNVLLSNKGTILNSSVTGQVMVKCLLSFMPECKFGMNDKLVMQKDKRGGSGIEKGIQIDDIKFHQCVRLGKFDRERAITFVPPDGVFELMTYRITENINLPFKVIPLIHEIEKRRIDVSLKVKAIFDKNIAANNVVIKVPTPRNVGKTNIYAIQGKARYEPENGGIMWRIRKFQGDSEFTLRAEIDLISTSTDKQWSRPPISLEFQVPMFTASGLRVRFLRVIEKSNYKPTKWIRYITKAGQYQHRI